jgi:hypothetical protein
MKKKRKPHKPFIQSVVFLQAHIRGYLVRKSLSNKNRGRSNGMSTKADLNRSAIVIQKAWRVYMYKKNRDKSLERLQLVHFCQQVRLLVIRVKPQLACVVFLHS